MFKNKFSPKLHTKLTQLCCSLHSRLNCFQKYPPFNLIALTTTRKASYVIILPHNKRKEATTTTVESFCAANEQKREAPLEAKSMCEGLPRKKKENATNIFLLCSFVLLFSSFSVVSWVGKYNF